MVLGKGGWGALQYKLKVNKKAFGSYPQQFYADDQQMPCDTQIDSVFHKTFLLFYGLHPATYYFFLMEYIFHSVTGV